MENKEVKKMSYQLRKDIIELCYRCKGGHVGGSLSSIDILNTLYFHQMKIDPKHPNDKNRDYFILSKGHVAEALYATLSRRGYFEYSELDNFSKYKSEYFGHPSSKVKGIEINTGALGHGLSIGVGIALANKKLEKDNKCYVLMGDGELAEGSVWEAAMAASHYELDNLCVIVDRNRLQISGKTEDVMRLENLKEKWLAFGFNVLEINGHNYEELFEVFQQVKKNQPMLIIANTIKGKGISFMENDPSWHHGVLSDEQYRQCLKELEEQANEE